MRSIGYLNTWFLLFQYLGNSACTVVSRGLKVQPGMNLSSHQFFHLCSPQPLLIRFAGGIDTVNGSFDWPIVESICPFEINPKNKCQRLVTFSNIVIERLLSDFKTSFLKPYILSAVVVEWLAWRSCPSSLFGSIPSVSSRTCLRSMATAIWR